MKTFDELLNKMPMDEDSKNFIEEGVELQLRELRLLWLRGYVEGVISVAGTENVPDWLKVAMHLLKGERDDQEAK